MSMNTLTEDVKHSSGSWLQRVWQQYRNDLIVFVVYVLLTLIVTYPIVFRLSTHLVGGGNDALEHLWMLWWGKKAMIELRTSMANVSYLYYPWGTYHPILSVTPLMQILELPFALLFEPLLAYNLFFLSTFILTCLTTYWLCYEITKDRWAAFVGGLIFGFAPTRAMHGVGHLAQITTYLFPIYALMVIRFMRRPNYKSATITGAVLGVSALLNFVHTAHFVFIFTLYWLIYFLLENKIFVRLREFLFSPTLRALLLLFGIAFVISAPFFINFVWADHTGKFEYDKPGGALSNSTNLLSFLLPSPFHPLVKLFHGENKVMAWLGHSFAENLAYVGVVPLALAIWGCLRDSKSTRFWLYFGAVTIILSMGPVLQFAGNRIVLDTVDGVDIHIPLPYLLLRILPLFDMGRTPARIAVGTPLALAVLVSVGMVRLRTWISRHRAWHISTIVGVISLIVLFEYCIQFPYPNRLAEIPEFYAQVRDEEGDFAILDYPLNREPPWEQGFSRALYYQTLHERPIAGGRVWRLARDGMRPLPALNALFDPEGIIPGDILKDVERPVDERVGWLSTLGFRYVILHKYKLSGLKVEYKLESDQVAQDKEYFTTLFSSPIYEDEYIIAFRVPETELVAETPLHFIDDGWYDVDGASYTYYSRWMGQEASIKAIAEHQISYRLAFDADAFNKPRGLTMVVNDQPIYTTTVNFQRRFVTPAFVLEPGVNEIVFKALAPCDKPSMVHRGNTDERCLSVRFTEVALIPPDQVYGEYAASIQFDDYIRLIGYDLSDVHAYPEGKLDLVLYWEILEPFDIDTTVFTHLINSEGELIGQKDSIPVHGLYQTTWLGKGEVVRDEYEIPIQPGASPGEYELRLGWYDAQTGERLRLREDTAIDGLDPLTYAVLEDIKVREGE